MSESEIYYREVKGLSVEEYPILGRENHGVIEWMENFNNHQNKVKNNDSLHGVMLTFLEGKAELHGLDFCDLYLQVDTKAKTVDTYYVEDDDSQPKFIDETVI